MSRPPDSQPESRRSTALFYRLAEAQLERPWTFLLVAAVSVVASLLVAARLEIQPGFEALLPPGRHSVQELERVKQRTAGVSNIMVVLEGDDTAALRKAADAVVEGVEPIGRPWVGNAESGVHEAIDFLEPRALLYPDLAALKELHDDLEERFLWEVGEATGSNLQEEGYVPPEIDPESVKKRLGVAEEQQARYPDGYYQSPDGKAVVVAIRSAVLATDYEQGNEAIAKVREAIERVSPASFHPSIRWGLSGDLVTGIAEYNAIGADLMDVGILGGILIVGVVFLYYLRLRTLLSMILSIGIGVAWSFAAAEVLVGHLTMATGFLFSIIAGNGINSGIIYMARYLEARRRFVDVRTAVRIAHRDTWAPTLTAALAAAASYGSLVVTEFRGFREFGYIGGVAMVLCWIATYLFLPSILILADRIVPLDRSSSSTIAGRISLYASSGVRFGTPFAAVIARFPRAITLAGTVLTVVATTATVGWIARDPMEYDLANLRTDMSARAEEERLSAMAKDITGFVGSDGMAILVERSEQVPLLVAALEQRRDAAPADAKPFASVHALQDFVPRDQSAKLELVQDIKDVIVRSHKRGFVKEEDWKDLERFLPPEDLRPFGIDDLPEGLARSFTEADGTRGRILYIAPISRDVLDDAHYILRWAESFRRTDLPDGSVVYGSGRAVIYADIWEAVISDVPKAVPISLVVTVLVVGLSFRRGFASAAVIFSLLAGVVWMAGLLAAAGVRINFLNFVALPVTFGIGVDYAVNIMQRYRREGAGGALTAVRETGGAVILCSLTTAFGYLALVRSMNQGVRGLGIAAVLGEIACLVTAVTLLPAALAWRDARRQARDRARTKDMPDGTDPSRGAPRSAPKSAETA
jgi:predicted RND superfamily exporter protein